MWTVEDKYWNTLYFAVSYNATLCRELIEVLHYKLRGGVVLL